MPKPSPEPATSDLHRRLDGLYRQALTFRTNGRLPEADRLEAEAAQLVESLRRQVQEYPDDPATAGALLFLAEREWSMRGDDPAVQSMIEEAVELREKSAGRQDPSLAEALMALADFHFLAGRWGQAEPIYRRAVALSQDETSGAIHAKSCGGLAQTLTHLGRAPEADPFFEKAIALLQGSDPDKRVLYFLYTYRAEGLEKMKRNTEAEDIRRKAAALLPRNNPGEAGFHV